MAPLSDHYKKVARSMTELETYLPAIAKVMRAKGILSTAELWERVEQMVEESPHFFKYVSYTSINQAVRHQRIQGYTTGRDFTNSAYAVAAALDKSVEELFGPMPELLPSITNMEDAANAFEIWGDVYANARDGLSAHRDNDDLKTLVQEQLKVLNNQQKEVIESAFGLTREPMTQGEIAEQTGVSRQRVTKVVQSGLEKIRQSIDTDLRGYLHGPKF